LNSLAWYTLGMKSRLMSWFLGACILLLGLISSLFLFRWGIIY